jgi:hypothetical protein
MHDNPCPILYKHFIHLHSICLFSAFHHSNRNTSVSELPFGGIGGSGMGAYHGKHSFNVFSHQRALMMKDLSMEAVMNLR